MLATLRRIILEFSRNAELESALFHMVTQVKEALNTDCCSVYLADYTTEQFVLMASDGLAKDALGTTRIGFSEGLVGLVGQREELLNISNAHEHPQFIKTPLVQEDDLNAFLGTPIIHQRKVLGILSIQQREARSFNENEEAFLVTLSAQLAMALVNAEARNNFAEINNQHSKKLQGVSGSSGVAIGELVVIEPTVNLQSVVLKKQYNIPKELKLFHQAITDTRHEINIMAQQLSVVISDSSLDIFEMYKQLLDNANLGLEIEKKIHEGWSAQSALKIVVDSYTVKFEALEDSYLRERTSDIKDLGNRLLANLLNKNEKINESLDSFILVAEDVTAAMLAEYQHRGLKGIVSFAGSNNSHAAILAKSLGLPAIMGVEKIPLGQLDRQVAIVDGYTGELYIAPNESLLKEYQHLIEEEYALADKVKTVEKLPAITLDGKCIELQLNAGLSSGFEHSTTLGAMGIGLYRTEIPFMSQSYFPSEQQQTVLYQQVLSAFPKQSVTMRTLDVGGDKALPYFPIVEDNPFLGWRGIRITLDHPEIFLQQVRAMIRANYGHNNLEIMLPMISNISEVDESTRLINQAYYELSAELGITDKSTFLKPKIGMMIEVPSVIFQLKEFASRVDFFSVGSNDLTQYLLAVDRNNAQVADLYDAYHPAVLRALKTIADESNKYLVPLSLCGELAGEPTGALLLLAMGYDKLSLNPHHIAKIKWVIRHVEMQKAKIILSHVLSFSSAKEVHSYLREQFEILGLGGFVRAGM